MNGVPVARLLGFEIRIHLSWAFVLAIIAVTVVSEVGRLEPATSSLVRWTIALVVCLVFLLSAVAHELGHAVAARRVGLPVEPVIVYFFGGTTSPRTGATTARDEVGIALAGPVVSLAIGGTLAAIGLLGEWAGDGPWLVVTRIALLVGGLDLILGAVNLLPAYPLDGGRVARGIAWGRTGDRRRASEIATQVGRWVGRALAAVGVLTILAFDSIDGLMLALAGWFLVSTNRAVDRGVAFDALLEDLRVDAVMDHDVSGILPSLSLDTFAGRILDGSAPSTLPVIEDGRLVGIISARQVRRLRTARWPQTRAGDVMVRGETLPPVGPETSLRTVLDDLRRSDLDGLPVLDAGRLTGIVTRDAVVRAIQERLRVEAVKP